MSIGKISRRGFLQATGVAGVAAAFPGHLFSAEREPILKVIPSSGEKIPVIGMGTSRTFDVEIDDELYPQLGKVLQLFFDHGGALIDSSPMYGNAEVVVGSLLQETDSKKALFAATKVWTYGRESGMEQMSESMERMGVAVMDLMQVHNLRDWKVHLPTLRDWKEQGRIRYVGITTSSLRQFDSLAEIMEREPLDFIQLNYNIEVREAEKKLLPLAQDKGIATLINRPYKRGAVFGRVQGHDLPSWAAEFDCESWGQFFLKFLVSHPAVTCPIPATTKPHHMIDNMGAGFGRLPDANTRARMIDFYESL
ncbi:MAG: aldo/keto reductase [Gammaproteobacteria bacterium]